MVMQFLLRLFYDFLSFLFERLLFVSRFMVLCMVFLLFFFVSGIELEAESFTTGRIVSYVSLVDFPETVNAFGGDTGSPAGDGNLFDRFRLIGLTKESIIVKSLKNQNVKGLVELSATLSNNLLLDIPRAYVKVRFPSFRLLIGKAHVSWGEGFMFNSGDVIFGGNRGSAVISCYSSSSSMTDNGGFSIGALSGENGSFISTTWLGDLYIPFGRFSYAEFVIFPYLFLSSLNGDSFDSIESVTFPTLKTTSLGMRIVSKLWKTKIEAGGLWKDNNLLPYISLQGHLFVNWSLSCSTRVDFEPILNPPDAFDDFNDFLADSVFPDIKENLSLSGAIYGGENVTPFPWLPIGISYRLESLIFPFLGWNEREDATRGLNPGYALFMYGDASLSFDSSLTWFLRGIVSPIDFSGSFYTGTRWSMYQGFSMIFGLSFQGGDSNDVWGWDRFGDFALLVGCEFKF